MPLIVFLTRPLIVFYTVLWLMVLLVLGTVAQRYVGLYVAQETFFYSWIFWIGPVPTPGGLPTLGLLTVALAAKLAFASTWSWARAGTLIIHFGALLLLLGGLATFVMAKEGSVALFEGESARAFTAYHDRSLVVENAETGAVLLQTGWYDLRLHQPIMVPGTPITVTPVEMCRNCAFTEQDPDTAPIEYQGRARNFRMSNASLETNDETNRSAILFRVAGTGTDKDGVHLSTDFIGLSPWVRVGDITYNIALRKDQYPLPFQVQLLSFKKTIHPGTDTARSYSSTVLITDGDATWQATISMNEPLRYRGYTLYQASFIQDSTRQGSVLAVVKNSGRLFPYIASILMAVGLLLHAIITLRTRLLIITALVAISGAPMAYAGTSAPVDVTGGDFPALAIQDHGRIKPLDTFARSSLEMISGRDHTPDGPAIAWLARLLFTPDDVADNHLFQIQNRDVQDLLALPPRRGNRYSFNEVMPALTRTKAVWEPLLVADVNKLSLQHRYLLELLQNVDMYAELAGSFALWRPDIVIDDKKLAKQLGVTPGAELTIQDLKQQHQTLKKSLENLARKARTKNPTTKMAAHEIALVELVGRMEEIDTRAPTRIFRVIPGQDDAWQTPVSAAQIQLKTKQSLVQWQKLLVTYRNGDQQEFTRAASTLHEYAPTGLLDFEVKFNRAHIFDLSLAFYLLAFFLAVICLIKKPTPLIHRAVWLAALSGLTLHIAGLVARMVITARPPVTNLYDSIIFVGLAAVIILLVLERRDRYYIMMLLAAFTGALLQSIGLKFDAEGDTMRVLVAVLDTNFWLSTHVVMITLGYGAAIVTALLAHGALVTSLWPRHPRTTSLPTYTHLISLIALFLTTIGTILGGIWADQSWGRFWGWDPKENGALLIILWLIWVLHGRLGGLVRGPTYHALMALLGVIVATAWFGVNLLGVGLHSYGFTQTATIGFVAFVIIDTILIGVMWVLARRRVNKTS